MKKHIVTLSTAAVLSSTLATSAMASTYTVKSGDNLSKIAKIHDTTVTRLKQLNNLKSDVIHINQKLQVSENPSPSSSKSKITVHKTTTAYYTVKAGDTLLKIANKQGITLGELKNWNKINGHLIYPGQKLIVSKKAASTTIELPANKPSRGKKEEKQSTAPAAGTVYTVKQGDSLSKIASKFGLSVTELKSINKLTSDVIYTGQRLVVSKTSGKPVQDTAVSDQPASNGEKVGILLAEAKKQIGVPYSWGGSSPSGFDCSGFVYYVYKKAGYQISRYSSSTYFDMGKRVTAPQPGDLVFFSPSADKKYLITHMGIYMGGQQFIHASSSKGVRISSLDESYYKTRFAGYKRL
ncbi:C40 family peptidase [Peribacillus glennii]|uniref:Peptidoglycan endopeptidase n=1 Tax=Peribacillus glennii TaxID=2303991 RepID=A0A372LD77_9BACI|nr:peptidoglycan endopeptidase [Peribacillus glennii]RFU63975.1 peptidoglycan endopeptidase [Peribacillus glennii]